MMLSSGGSGTKLVLNEPIVIDEQAATLTTLLGNVKIMTINYKVILEYQCNTAENYAYFKMFIQSDKSIPEVLVNFMLPKNVIDQPGITLFFMTNRASVLCILEEHHGRFFSGEEIASRLVVSRSAVWKAVKSLEAEWYTLLYRRTLSSGEISVLPVD